MPALPSRLVLVLVLLPVAVVASLGCARKKAASAAPLEHFTVTYGVLPALRPISAAAVLTIRGDDGVAELRRGTKLAGAVTLTSAELAPLARALGDPALPKMPHQVSECGDCSESSLEVTSKATPPTTISVVWSQESGDAPPPLDAVEAELERLKKKVAASPVAAPAAGDR